VTEKGKKIAQLLGRVGASWTPPSESALATVGEDLLHLGLYLCLRRVLTEAQTLRTIAALREAYPDWNELRVSQAQEYEHLIDSKDASVRVRAAREVREFLYEIFQKNHGYDLSFLRADPGEAGRFVSQLPFLGSSAAHWLLWHASGGRLPVSPSIVRCLDRLGIAKRTSSMAKALEQLEGHVQPEMRAEFAVQLGHVVDRWCDPKRPICWECVLVESCPYGRKVQREWKAQQRRLEIQRKRDLERERKEAEKARREEERQRKRAEGESRRRAAASSRALLKKQREEQKRRAVEEKRREAEKRAAKLAAERARREAERKKAARKPAPRKAASGRKRR
jgi:endonuclease III